MKKITIKINQIWYDKTKKRHFIIIQKYNGNKRMRNEDAWTVKVKDKNGVEEERLFIYASTILSYEFQGYVEFKPEIRNRLSEIE